MRDELRADRAAARAHRAQVRDQEHHRLPAVRLPRRRHAARDLPAAARRLGGDARASSPRRCSTRSPSAATRRSRCALFEDIDAAVDAVPELVAAGATRDRADGRPDADRGRLEHAGHARALEGARAARRRRCSSSSAPKSPGELDGPERAALEILLPRATRSTRRASRRERERDRDALARARGHAGPARRDPRPGRAR